MAFAAPTAVNVSLLMGKSRAENVLLRANVTLEPASEMMPKKVKGTERYASGTQYMKSK